MPRDARTYLFDIQQAAELIAGFTTGRTFADYVEDPMLRAAVERQFEIIGEARNQLTRVDASRAAQISEHRRIIAFRNILIHAYAAVDHQLVWDIVETRIPVLRREINGLLAET